jgi:hypothetical protein
MTNDAELSAVEPPGYCPILWRMGLEGIVSKPTDAAYRSGRSRTWLKFKHAASDAVRREHEEDWST